LRACSFEARGTAHGGPPPLVPPQVGRVRSGQGAPLAFALRRAPIRPTRLEASPTGGASLHLGQIMATRWEFAREI
jgi:hypothetical protein